ncbi:hypothetical protein WA1_28050 [Scytonema hofmannii PCC 7110]|uniref:Uncharacterized protein n=1 Tax=Scytonema hofmannii PCC 7110 TaxID=128403 RepID=A0A139X547_9CYAN|nr:hypothetical protein [Scytonema hofmannii]KYC39827.1 hypothetical protein WA1_28050 [Scytonema hofmannii PCC 7110]
MKTLHTTAKVNDSGQLTVDIPVNMSQGEYQLVLVIEERPVEKQKTTLQDFPVISIGSWPENLSLRREDMYGDDGR